MEIYLSTTPENSYVEALSPGDTVLGIGPLRGNKVWKRSWGRHLCDEISFLIKQESRAIFALYHIRTCKKTAICKLRSGLSLDF